MTADAFLEWTFSLPKGERHELFAGRAYRMPSERVSHARTKREVSRQLDEATRRLAPRCELFLDRMAAQTPDGDIDEPDATV